ncbi:LIM domain-binding protein 2 isoform X7 [Crotalus tigris]|uniref:LIM domain-binding protein 2 isoform X7 n=1 Tax=Crotalus tigris TaxID=88082 RepID=UPI00192F2EFA|nr:LIM domain-binding protein 2 isoform X7 [Crotalus tigris]
MSTTSHDPFYSSPFGPFYRRHTSYMVQPEYRIYEMNKRLQVRSEDSDNLWWDAFATEFFEDDATVTLSFCLEDGPKRYTIGRTLIPRYFSTIFEGGVTDLYYILKHSKESYHSSSITVDCDQCTMVSQHGKPMFTKVCTEGRLILEFTFDDLMRIKTWHFTIRQYRELVPRSILAMHAQDPQILEQLSKNITRMGLTNFTLNYLREIFGCFVGQGSPTPDPWTGTSPWHARNRTAQTSEAPSTGCRQHMKSCPLRSPSSPHTPSSWNQSLVPQRLGATVLGNVLLLALYSLP